MTQDSVVIKLAGRRRCQFASGATGRVIPPCPRPKKQPFVQVSALRHQNYDIWSAWAEGQPAKCLRKALTRRNLPTFSSVRGRFRPRGRGWPRCVRLAALPATGRDTRNAPHGSSCCSGGFFVLTVGSVGRPSPRRSLCGSSPVTTRTDTSGATQHPSRDGGVVAATSGRRRRFVGTARPCAVPRVGSPVGAPHA